MSQEVIPSGCRVRGPVSCRLWIWICFNAVVSISASNTFQPNFHSAQSAAINSNNRQRQQQQQQQQQRYPYSARTEGFSSKSQSTAASEFEQFRQIVGEGLNASDYIINVLEPQLYYQGQVIQRGDASAGVAAFNYQQATTKDMARYGYATLKAFALYQEKLSSGQRSRPSDRIPSIRQTSFYRDCPLRVDAIQCPPYSSRFRTADGTCNNRNHPEWGAAFWPFHRFLPASYSDGVDKVRRSVTGKSLPNPRKVSSTVHRSLDITGTKFTTMLMQWGQFLDHDLTSSAQSRGFNGSIPECCHPNGNGELHPDYRHPDCMPIQVDDTDSFFHFHHLTCLNFVRSSPGPHKECALGPRDQINQITSFLDASNVYGSTKEHRNSLRLFRGGKMKFKDLFVRKALMPELLNPQEDECLSKSRNIHCFKGGDNRANEQPGLSSMHTMWLREHNRIVSQLSQLNPHWNDQRLFHEGRKIVGAQMQHITYNEYLPIILGERVMQVFELQLERQGYFGGYDRSVNPSAANVFSTAAFRFGHSLIPKNLNRCNRHHQLLPSHTLLRKELMDPSPIHNIGSVDRIILGMCSQPSMRRDEFIVDEMTNHLFEPPNKSFGMDLISLDIQRGRDHGIPAYVVWREACGLTPLRNWGQLLTIMDEDTVGRLRITYKYLDDIDLFAGAMSEKPVIGGIVGPTQACIIAQQFLNLRHGDRFWYENGDKDSAFTPSQLSEVRKMTLSRLICDNLDDVDTVQKWVFLLPDSIKNARFSCLDKDAIRQMNLNAWAEKVANVPGQDTISFKSAAETDYESVAQELSFDHRFRMPSLEPEDDWVSELPRQLDRSSFNEDYENSIQPR